MESLHEVACNAIANDAEELNELSQSIWNNPELCFKETHAHDELTGFLERKGLPVERHYELPTGFICTTGSGTPHVAILCEYDALPEIGHACGHNLIAEAGIAAGLGVNAAFQKHGTTIGKVYSTTKETHNFNHWFLFSWLKAFLFILAPKKMVAWSYKTGFPAFCHNVKSALDIVKQNIKSLNCSYVQWVFTVSVFNIM